MAVHKILVVDDTPANLLAAEAALAPLDRPIVIANSGEEALGHLLEQEFALALLDVHMPAMDGYELARLIRSRERTQHLPIIFMTAHAQDEVSVLRAYDLGAVDFLFRPVIPEVLRAKASVLVALQERNVQLATERIERDREQAAREELARLNTALAEYDRRKDSFIAILAHELRNPLASLRTCVDLIQASPTQPLTPRVITALDRQTNVLVRLVEDLLDVSRIKADKIELRPELVDLAELVEAAVATNRALIDERRHALALDVPSARVMVIADTVRFSQVVGNLLSNAARYTPPGGRVEVTVTATGDYATVSVRDNGAGIPSDLQESIFQMFVQERVRSDGSGGLGLGLALSRRLIEMHNGSITVHSNGRNEGSTFEIHIPLASSALAVAARKRTTDMQPLQREPLEARSARIIVVDDNEDARELICELLRGSGFDVLTASDGPSGVQLIRDHRPEVALVDLGLPQLDGFGVVEMLRRDCPDLSTRFVALTGYGHSSDYERTKHAGFHAHLVKPASAAAIVACIAKQLDDLRS